MVLTRSSVNAVELSVAVSHSCIENDAQAMSTMVCQSAASDDGSVNVPSLLQKVPSQGVPRIQVPALHDYMDEGDFGVQSVLPKLGQQVMEPGEGTASQEKTVAMVEISAVANKDSDRAKVPTGLENSMASRIEGHHPAEQHSVTSFAKQFKGFDQDSAVVENLRASNANETLRVSPPTEASPRANRSLVATPTHSNVEQKSNDLVDATTPEPLADVNQKTIDFAKGAIDFLQEDLQHGKNVLLENQTIKSEATEVELGSGAEASHPKHHKHNRHLLPVNRTYRHQIALAVRHLLEGYLQSARKHPLLSPLMSSRPKALEAKRSERGLAGYGSAPGSSEEDQPSFDEDGPVMTILYFGCILLSSCMILWVFWLSWWPAAGERFESALGIGSAVLIGKRAPDFTMTLLDGSL